MLCAHAGRRGECWVRGIVSAAYRNGPISTQEKGMDSRFWAVYIDAWKSLKTSLSQNCIGRVRELAHRNVHFANRSSSPSRLLQVAMAPLPASIDAKISRVPPEAVFEIRTLLQKSKTSISIR